MNLEEKPDYPFKTYQMFLDAFSYMLRTKFYGKKYPIYESSHYYYGFVINELLVRNFINQNHNHNQNQNHDTQFVQNAFEQFISAILDGQKYAENYLTIIKNIIKIFIDEGAQLNISRLLDRKYNIDQTDKYFEDEIVEYRVRAMLLDILSEYNINLFVKRYCDWKDIKPTYYENIPCNTNYDTARYMVLKYYSKYLQSL